MHVCKLRTLQTVLQEMPDEVPSGATPRCINVHLRGDITRSMKAGDTVCLGGIFLPEPFTGWKALRYAAAPSSKQYSFHFVHACLAVACDMLLPSGFCITNSIQRDCPRQAFLLPVVSRYRHILPIAFCLISRQGWSAGLHLP